MRRKKIDDNHFHDLDVLARAKLVARIDFIQWTHEAHIPIPHEDVIRQGNRCTWHDPTPRQLANVSADQLALPLAAVEIAVDFELPLTTTEAQMPEALLELFKVVVRRLAPWGSPRLADRMMRSYRAGTGQPNMNLGAHFGESDDGSPVVFDVDDDGEGDTPTQSERKRALRQKLRCEPMWPIVERGQILGAFTHLFGHKVQPTWGNLSLPITPGVQVKTYIKTTDRGASLPWQKHRVRAEITLNGHVLLEVLGVKTIGDLLSANLRPLATKYLRFARPEPSPPKWARVKSRGQPKDGPLTLRLLAERDARRASAKGNFTQMGIGMVDFKTVPEMTEPVAYALQNLRDTLKRNKTSGISPGLAAAASCASA